MRVHEYQAKNILSKHGAPVPRGGVASTAREAADMARELGGAAVVKAQVHAGGRGKAGGVRVVSSAGEAGAAAEALLGANLVTVQTGPRGVPVRRVLVEEVLDIESELYLSMVIDASAGGVVAIASEAGGVDIEEVAASTPDKILRIGIDSGLGVYPFQARKLAFGLGLRAELRRPYAKLVADLYSTFLSNDCTLVEINPLAATTDGRVLAADAKLDIDDDALFRHPELAGLRDPDQDDPREAEAREHDISYVKLDGNVGCVVNGAGLAMATMDVAVAAGAMPANFLDVGGGADEERVAQAMRIILRDPDVTCILVNLFGGILRSDVAARGFLMAAEEMPGSLRPMVVRMLGTNAEEGRRLLADSGLDVTLVHDLDEAAKAVKAVVS